MSDTTFNVAIVGLGFGAEFIPIYQAHRNANLAAICQRTRSKLDHIGDAFAVEKRYASYDELLADPEIDVVHINTPIPDHAPQSIQALRAGKHVACTVLCTRSGTLRAFNNVKSCQAFASQAKGRQLESVPAP